MACIALLSVHCPSCLDLNCRVSARAPDLGRDRCKSGQYKISEHLGREAVRYDEHYSLILGRGVGQHFEGTATAQIEPFAGCSALPHLRPVRLRLSPSWGEVGNDPT